MQIKPNEPNEVLGTLVWARATKTHWRTKKEDVAFVRQLLKKNPTPGALRKALKDPETNLRLYYMRMRMHRQYASRKAGPVRWLFMSDQKKTKLCVMAHNAGEVKSFRYLKTGKMVGYTPQVMRRALRYRQAVNQPSFNIDKFLKSGE
jgi:hypothetical protein